jgi:hypothetical protein
MADANFKAFLHRVMSGTFDYRTASEQEKIVARTLSSRKVNIGEGETNLLDYFKTLDASSTAPIIDEALKLSNEGGHTAVKSVKDEAAQLLKQQAADEAAAELLAEEELAELKQKRKQEKKARQAATRALASSGGGGGSNDEKSLSAHEVREIFLGLGPGTKPSGNIF